MPKLDTIKSKGVSPEEYVRTIKLAKYQKMFEDKINETPVKEDTVNEIAELVKTKQITIRVFAAVWCKDTLKTLPAVTYITKQIPEIDLKILGGIKNVPFDKKIRWKVPPSPPEVDTFDIRAVPTFIFFDKNGEEIGRVKEPPEVTETVEDEILHYLKMLPD